MFLKIPVIHKTADGNTKPLCEAGVRVTMITINTYHSLTDLPVPSLNTGNT